MLGEHEEKPRAGGGTPKDVTEVRLTPDGEDRTQKKRPAEHPGLKHLALGMASESHSLTTVDVGSRLRGPELARLSSDP